MTIKGIPFDAKKSSDGTYDRVVYSEDIANYFRYLSSNGILLLKGKELTDELKVSYDGIVTTVNTGSAIIEGRVANVTEKESLTHDYGGTLPRYDLVVLELNTLIEERRFILKIVKGEESASPVQPELTRTSSIYQLALARVKIEANSTTISELVDLRWDSEVCGKANTVTRVKGNSESTYRSGDVNLTPQNLGAAPSQHYHDDRYYTESEVDNLLKLRAESKHTHSTSDITFGTLPISKGGTGNSEAYYRYTSTDGTDMIIGEFTEFWRDEISELRHYPYLNMCFYRFYAFTSKTLKAGETYPIVDISNFEIVKVHAMSVYCAKGTAQSRFNNTTGQIVVKPDVDIPGGYAVYVSGFLMM